MRRRAVRRGGSTVVTLGNLAIMGSVAVMLAVGPRLLGASEFSGLALAWTVVTVFGYGIAMPAEQIITRRIALGSYTPRKGPVALLSATALAFSAILILTRGLMPHTGATWVMVVGAVAGVVGWAAAVICRGQLAGAGDLRAYAASSLLEAASRVALIGMAVTRPEWADVFLAAGLGLPIGISAIVRLLIAPQGFTRTSTGHPRSLSELSVVGVWLGYQLSLNGAPLALGFHVSGSLDLGQFVSANSYFRVAGVLAAGFATHLLVESSHLRSTKRLPEVRPLLLSTVGKVSLLALTASATAAALSPILLPLYYGSVPDIPGSIVLALAASTLICTTGFVTSAVLLAFDRDRTASAWWALSAATTLLVVVASNGNTGGIAIGLVLGPLLAFCASALSAFRATGTQTLPLGQQSRDEAAASH